MFKPRRFRCTKKSGDSTRRKKSQKESRKKSKKCRLSYQLELLDEYGFIQPRHQRIGEKMRSKPHRRRRGPHAGRQEQRCLRCLMIVGPRVRMCPQCNGMNFVSRSAHHDPEFSGMREVVLFL